MITSPLDKPGTSNVVARSNLQVQTLSTATYNSTTLINATATQIDWSTKRGWYVDLLTAGQRVVTAPQLLNGAFLATLNTPPANVCSNVFTSQFIELNFANGGAFDTPQIDVTGDGLINASDTINNKNPVGITLPGGFASSPTVIGPNNKNQYIKLITLSGGTQQSVRDPNNTPRRITWWQIK